MKKKITIFGLIILILILIPGTAAFEISGTSTEEGVKWLNEHWGENITMGQYEQITEEPEVIEQIKANVPKEQLDAIWSQPYYWGSRHPWGAEKNTECPYGANVWEDSRPLNIKKLNFSQKQEMGIENAVTDKNGCRIIGYMDQLIMQGEKRPFHRLMPSNLTRFTYDLFWQDQQNSLKLSIFAPDGMMGPYYDNSDGIVNGRIYVQVSREEGISPGDWYAVVEGERVNGTQQFMLLVV
ncbi:MAG: hypothetical protein M0Q92_11580 [Methanoregula sp.]|jgi:hypothetical protein|nr:hypothetical protein [Methanoregula sp.]